MNLKLIYFTGCPNHQPAVNLLKSAGLEFESVCQDDLEEKHPFRGYSSPSLLNGNEIVSGSLAEGGGCSIELPTLKALKNALK